MPSRPRCASSLSLLACLLLPVLPARVLAQQRSPLPANPAPKTAVNPDGSITFRYIDAGATKITVTTDALSSPTPLTRGADGVWSSTTPPLSPEHYGYSFLVDGPAGHAEARDPFNPEVQPNLAGLSSDILVPAALNTAGHTAAPAPWELAAIAHGRIDHHTYTTRVARHVPQNQSSYVVYTPPGYDPRRKGGYPVLYLLHGWSQTETSWTATGRADWMLDRLLADGQIVPMVVVMPLGYGDFDFVTTGFGVWDDSAKVDSNVDFYSRMLLGEILPAVEREYNIAPGRENRAITGLSMGGLESLSLGLQHPDLFAWVGGFSSAIHQEHFDEHFPALDAKKANLRLLWIACGTGDGLLRANRDFVEWARAKSLPVTPVETPGRHTWLVWRDNLLHFTPLLFRNK